jgi:hypothetical protein
LLNLGLLPALYLAFGCTRSRPGDEEAEVLSTSLASANNWASHSPQPALAAVSTPADSDD